MRSLRIATPFFDRIWLLRHCLTTLAMLKQQDAIDFIVYCDAGHDLKADALIAETLPPARKLVLPQHLGAGGMTHRIVEDFAVSADADQLLIVDADMIARTDLAQAILSWPVSDDMLVSVYNSNSHSPVHPSNAPFVHKSSLGATGTLWSPQMAQMVIEHVATDSHFDNRFSEYLANCQIPMCCSNRSYLQHLGVDGMNNRHFGRIDYGLNFTPDAPEQAAAMAQVFNDMMSNQAYYRGKTDKRREAL